jgi:large subunit ribosomal protein L25
VEFNFIGESLAVKAQGGTLVKVLTDVEVEALPKDLPQHLDVDISVLDTFDKVITIKDIKVPAGVTLQAEDDELVVKVQPPRDMEAEMASQIGDVSQVEGIADKAPEAPAAE